MTVPVPDQLEYVSNADGVTKDFPYPKRFLQKDEIVVLLRDANGVDTPQILNTHYTIAGSSWPSGGTVSFINAPQAPNKVVRYRMTQAKQTVDLENNQRNDAPSVETQLDRLTMGLQDRGRIADIALSGLKAEIQARIAADAVLQQNINAEAAARAAADQQEKNARIAGDNQERIERIAGDLASKTLINAEEIARRLSDSAIQAQISGILPSVNQATARAVAAADSAEASASVAQSLVEAAASGFQGFEEDMGYDFGFITQEMTYFNRDFGSITDPVTA